MTDIQKLKALAEAAKEICGGAAWAYEPHGDTGEFGVGVLEDDRGNPVAGRHSSGEMLVLESVAPEVSCEAYAAYIAAANPVALLALIEENESLRTNADRYAWVRSADPADVEYVSQQMGHIKDEYIDEALGKGAQS